MWFRSQDVLNVIGKILCFSEEQLRIVGLKHQPYSMLGSLYTSILSVPSEGVEVRPFPTPHTANIVSMLSTVLSIKRKSHFRPLIRHLCFIWCHPCDMFSVLTPLINSNSSNSSMNTIIEWQSYWSLAEFPPPRLWRGRGALHREEIVSESPWRNHGRWRWWWLWSP